MTSRVLITGWVGTGARVARYRPDLDMTGCTRWGAIKLRGHPAVDPDALCLVVADYPAASRIPTRDATTRGNWLRDLGQDTDTAQLSIATTALIAADLGVVAPSRATIGELVVLAQAGLQGQRNNRLTVEINGHVLHTQPFVRGGATDSFTYSNGALSSVSSGVWVTVTGAPGELPVTSNALGTIGSPTVSSLSNAYSTQFATDHYAQFDVTATAAAAGAEIGPTVRQSITAQTMYSGTFVMSFGGGEGRIDEYTAGSGVTLATLASTTAGLFRLEAEGSHLRLYRNGAQVLSTTDATIAANTRVGVVSYNDAGTSFTGDNFEGGDLLGPRLVGVGGLLGLQSGTSLGGVSFPSGDVADDIGILAFMYNSGSTFTTPTDWTVLGTAVNSANQSTAWFWKRLTGSDGDPTTTTSAGMSTSNGGYGRIWVFRNCVTTGDPFEDVTMAGTPTTSTTPQSAAIDTVGTDRLAVCFVMIDDDPAFTSGNPPALWSTCGAGASLTVGGDARFEAIQRRVPTASAVAAVTVGTLAAADYWRTLTLALIPVSVAVTSRPLPRRHPQLLLMR